MDDRTGGKGSSGAVAPVLSFDVEVLQEAENSVQFEDVTCALQIPAAPSRTTRSSWRLCMCEATVKKVTAFSTSDAAAGSTIFWSTAICHVITSMRSGNTTLVR